jgi:hypothetical protein
LDQRAFCMDVIRINMIVDVDVLTTIIGYDLTANDVNGPGRDSRGLDPHRLKSATNPLCRFEITHLVEPDHSAVTL